MDYPGQPTKYGPIKAQPDKQHHPFAPHALSRDVLEAKAAADQLGETYYLQTSKRNASQLCCRRGCLYSAWTIGGAANLVNIPRVAGTRRQLRAAPVRSKYCVLVRLCAPP